MIKNKTNVTKRLRAITSWFWPRKYNIKPYNLQYTCFYCKYLSFLFQTAIYFTLCTKITFCVNFSFLGFSHFWCSFIQANHQICYDYCVCWAVKWNHVTNKCLRIWEFRYFLILCFFFKLNLHTAIGNTKCVGIYGIFNSRFIKMKFIFSHWIYLIEKEERTMI